MVLYLLFADQNRPAIVRSISDRTGVEDGSAGMPQPNPPCKNSLNLAADIKKAAVIERQPQSDLRN